MAARVAPSRPAIDLTGFDPLSVPKPKAAPIEIDIVRPGMTTRILRATTVVRAPAASVWRALTEYDKLGDVIPSLAINNVIESFGSSAAAWGLPNCPTNEAAERGEIAALHGAVVEQVGEQVVAKFAPKFRARVVLDIREHPTGIARCLCQNHDGTGQDDPDRPSAPGREGAPLFPRPVPRRDPEPGTESRASETTCRDVSFEMLSGDFQRFQGVWRVQGPLAFCPDAPVPGASSAVHLCTLGYAVTVCPNPLLPVGLIEGRIEGDIQRNVQALKSFCEAQWAEEMARAGVATRLF